MGLGEFLKSKVFFKHLGLIIASFVVLLFIAIQLLNIYTRHGKEYIIPNIEGMELVQAKALSEMSPFEIIVIDSIFSPTEIPGKIITQDPKPESKAKKGRKIYLILTSNSGEKIAMPDCTDQSVRAAVNLLVNKGLRVRRLIFREGAFANLVVQQIYKGKQIGEGTQISKGEEIDLVIEMNPENTITQIPDILGLTEQEAEKKLWESSLNIGRKSFEGQKDISRSRVVSFSPSVKSLTIGSTVNLSFVNDTKPNFKQRLNSFKVQDNQIEEIIEEE